MRELLTIIRLDLKRSGGSAKSCFIVTFYRVSAYFAEKKSLPLRILGWPIRFAYKVVVEILMGVELPDRVVAGPGLAVFHGVGLVVNAGVRLGQNVTLRQNTTIGHSKPGGPVPIIGNDVDIGANAILLGGIVIGDRTLVGAGAIVLDSCTDGSTIKPVKSTARAA